MSLFKRYLGRIDANRKALSVTKTRYIKIFAAVFAKMLNIIYAENKFGANV